MNEQPTSLLINAWHIFLLPLDLW